jgi:hypothetical protein
VIEKDDVYESADPRDDGRQIRIVSWFPGYAKAQIVSHPSGKNHRQINVKHLHRDRNTGKGEPRRNGYFLVNQDDTA